MAIQIHGIFDSRFSLGEVSGAVASQVVDRFPQTRLNSILRPDADWDAVLERGGIATPNGQFIDASLSRFAGDDRQAHIGIFVGPATYAASFLKAHRFRIGLLVCETTRIAVGWVADINSLSLAIVPSEFCRGAFRRSGVTIPILVLPYGLGPEFHPYDDVRPDSNCFTFFNTFGAFAPPERKGFLELLRCFSAAFAGDDSTRLVIRTHATPAATRLIAEFGQRARIVLDPLTFSSSVDFARRLCSMHCVVHPSKGEGFGLIPFQAIGCEVPVIAPAASGMAQYLTTDNATIVAVSGLTTGTSWENQPGQYYQIDEEHLVRCLQEVRSNWLMKQQRLRQIGREFREQYSWARVLRPLMSILERLENDAPIDDLVTAAPAQ